MPACPCALAPGLCVQGIPEAAEPPAPAVRQGVPSAAAAAGAAEPGATGAAAPGPAGAPTGAAPGVPNVTPFNLFGPVRLL